MKTGKTKAITTLSKMKQMKKNSEKQPLLINPIIPSVKALSSLIVTLLLSVVFLKKIIGCGHLFVTTACLRIELY